MSNNTMKDSESAFPIPYQAFSQGISIRDYFAAAALTGFCSQRQHYSTPTQHLAGWAYQLADAMLQARKEGA